MQETTSKLQHLISTYAEIFRKSNPDYFKRKPSPEKWSNQEILGHLIDSAANNHQRFIRIQYEQEPAIVYDQNKWNSLSFYNAQDMQQLINLWESYNIHLLEIIKRIPEIDLQKTGRTSGEPVTLKWLITDYVEHMEHHLKQMTSQI